jgi:hypothetical protein
MKVGAFPERKCRRTAIKKNSQGKILLTFLDVQTHAFARRREWAASLQSLVDEV